ncbi:MAG: hypothetical protein WC346_21280 [Methanogenium sp.]|jgi:hypothetical protein
MSTIKFSDSKIVYSPSKHTYGLNFEEEIFTGEKFGDTKVTYFENTICFIAGNTIEEFDKRFREVIEEFRI